MVDDEKPFPCSSPGCTMRFANEDHLSIHKKRHMSLSIESNNGSKTPNFVADETPTPTRFIRNCEEVGLFQDLNVNPFDEQFRRAAEVTTLTAPSLPTADDVLHTPHVFPVHIESDVATQQLPPPKSANVRKNYLMPSLSTSECLTLPSPVSTPIPTPLITITAPPESQDLNHKGIDQVSEQSTNCDKTTPEPLNSSTSKKERYKKNIALQTHSKTITNPAVNIMPRPVIQPTPAVSDPLTALLLRLPDGRLVQIPAIPVPTEADTSNVAAKASSMVPMGVEHGINNVQPTKPALSEAKLKLKQALTKTKATITTQPLNVNSPSVTSDASGTDTEPIANSDAIMDMDDSTRPNRRRRGYNSSDPDLDEEESEKRRKFLERNRAAAFRSRQKRKRWVTNLEAKTTVMNTANRLLQNEVMSLRSEVAQLKLQLLAHKDCPVTLAMCQQASVPTNNSNDGGFAPMDQTRSGMSSTIPNNVSGKSPPRQIIILNTSNQNQTALPGSKPTHPQVILNHPPLVVVPRADTNIVPHNSNIVIRPSQSDLGQQTSVIMSVKMSDN